MAEFTKNERAKLAAKGHALPNGSYPITDCEDVKDAWGLRGHSETYSKERVAAFVKKRAKALGCPVPGDDDN